MVEEQEGGGGRRSGHLDGFQQMDQMGAREPPGRSIFTFSSPLLLRMLTTPLNIPRARYCPSLVQLFRQPPEGVGRGKGTRR